MIEGVELHSLAEYSDPRGSIREVFKISWNWVKQTDFAQITHSRIIKNTVKAWHYHRYQTDWWYLVEGEVLVFLVDFRAGSFGEVMEISLSSKKPSVLKIPPLVLHGLKVKSKYADLMYLTDKVYSPADEGRIPYNHPDIPVNWGKKVIVSPNDQKTILI
jgi:dTDP-4-dehydrorhamnose 3,5-epimerase